MDANEFALDAADLAEVMEKDVALGLTPMFVAANVGTTNSCAIDPVRALAKACRDRFVMVYRVLPSEVRRSTIYWVALILTFCSVQLSAHVP